MYHSLLIHSSTEGHLSCFQVLVIINEAAINLHAQVFVLTMITFYDSKSTSSKRKNRQIGLYQNLKLLCQKTINSENATNGMAEKYLQML